ncbi:MAG: Fic family protein [Anaerolineales bacterium]|jgi:Fic family protein|nr:Fic family protein [Anaerolineales bacterium]
MKRSDFHAPQAGKVIQMPTGYLAFIPAPLPPVITYSQEMALALSKADAALSELSGVGRYLPNPHLLIAPYIRREAVLSSRIEGTRTSLNELWLGDLETEGRRVENADIQEVRNYIQALEYGIQRLANLPLSLRLVREVHARLMQGVRGEHATPGEFRRSQNWIGPAGSTLATAPYIPPPPDELLPALDNWEKFLHLQNVFPDLIQCAVLHEHFEALHPFLDGNGRVGRLLISLFLIERGRLSQPLLYLSSYFETNRQDYYDLLQRVRTHGEWEQWIIYFLIGVSETSRQALEQTSRLMDLREGYRLALKDQPRALNLIDPLLENPYLTAARAEEILQVSHPTARKAIVALSDAGVVEEITGREWGKVYLARAIWQAISGA